MPLHLHLSVLLCVLCLPSPQVTSLVTRKSRVRNPCYNAAKESAIAMLNFDGDQRSTSRRNLAEPFSHICRNNQKKIVSAILTSSYISVVLSVYTLPVCLSAIYADSNFYSSSMKSKLLSKIVSAANLSNLAGKFILGPPTDYLGGDITMLITLALSAVSLFGCSLSPNVQTFGFFWIFFSFVFSAAWGAVGKIVRERFSKKEWALQLGLVYTGSRVGSMLSSLLFGKILRPSVTSPGSISLWRAVFRTASGILVSLIVLSFILSKLIVAGISGESELDAGELTLTNAASNDRKSATIIDASPTSTFRVPSSSSSMAAVKTSSIVLDDISRVQAESVLEVLSRLIKDESFWLILISKVSFVSVRQFSAFLPFYLTTGYSVSSSSAVFASTSFAFGSLLSSAVGTGLYYRLSGLSQIKLISVCNLFGCLLPGILWAHHSKSILLKNFLLPRQIVLLIISLWGIFWALPFGPSGALTLTLGGESHVAFLVNLSDAAGLLCASVLSYYALEFGKVGNWGPILLGLSIAGALALVSMSRAMLLQLEQSSP